MRTGFYLLLAGLLGLASSAPASSFGEVPTATIDSGVVFGSSIATAGASATAVNRYLGIPFAASPVRFAPPSAPTSWSQPYDATNFSLSCPAQFNYPEESRQMTMAFFNFGIRADEGEDCLNLNIWSPSSARPGSDKTVMVWIYGGGLNIGSNSLTVYDGTSFAANQDVIVVGINYRTNLYGFPGSPLLPLTENNLGFLDQRFALDWVQRNIRAFGGDPAKVTIFGESAGGASVDLLVLTQKDTARFRAAITESGTAALYSGLQVKTIPRPWNTMVDAVNCTDSSDVLACVRAVPQKDLTSVIEHLAIGFQPVIDNVTLPAHPESLRPLGDISPVPLMTGSNANEGRIFSLPYVNATSAVTYLKSTYGLTDQQAEALASLYPIPSPYISNGYEQISQIQTDFTFTCPAGIQFNNTHAAHYPTWRYYYNTTFPNIQPLSIDLGAFHSSEIFSVFGTYPTAGATEQQKRLSEYMQTSWATFARNPAGGPGWSGWPQVEVLGADQQGVGLGYSTPAGKIDDKCFAYEPLYRLLGVY